VPVRRGGVLSLFSSSHRPPSAFMARRSSIRPARHRNPRYPSNWRPCCQPSGEPPAASLRSSLRISS
jgi:hypothetical protein